MPHPPGGQPSPHIHRKKSGPPSPPPGQATGSKNMSHSPGHHQIHQPGPPPPPGPPPGQGYAYGPPPGYPGGHPQGGQQYGQAYAPPPASATTVIVVPQQSITSDHPTTVVCPRCHQSVVTMTSYETGLLTWLSAGACILFGLWFGCCLIPFFIGSLKDVRHDCPSCGNTIAKYKRL